MRAKGKQERKVGGCEEVGRDEGRGEVHGGRLGEHVGDIVVGTVRVIWVFGVTLDPADGDCELAMSNHCTDSRPLLTAGDTDTTTGKRRRSRR